MTAPYPPEEFAAELRALYKAAGSPTYARIVHQAGQQRPPLRLTEQSLSDWLRGVSVPADPAAVGFVVSYLGAFAKRSGHHVRGVDWWEALRARAWKAKQASRRGRPSTRVPGAASTATAFQPRPTGSNPIDPGASAVSVQQLGRPTAYLCRLGDLGALAVYPVVPGIEWKIGRHPDECDVIVPDDFPMVSRLHLLFGCDDTGSCWIESRGPNGTYLNDQRVPPNERRSLSTGDIVTLGGPRGAMRPPCTFLLSDLPVQRRVPPTDDLLSENATILALRANPTIEHRELDDEVVAIDRAIRSARFRDQLDLRQMGGNDLSDVINAVYRHTPAIMHFCGSGGTDRTINFAPPAAGLGSPADSLRDFFQLMSPPILCVIMSRCLNLGQAETIAKHVDCVIGTPHEFLGGAARAFSDTFYLALAHGESAQRSFELARAAATGDGARPPATGDSGGPLLLSRGTVAQHLRFTSERRRR